MALKFISRTSTPNYIALSTDVSDGTIAGLQLIGATVYLTDTGNWYLVSPDKTLVVYNHRLVAALFSVTSGELTLDGNVEDGGSTFDEVLGVAGVPVISSDMTTPTPVTSVPAEGTRLIIRDIVISVDTNMAVTLSEEDGDDLLKIFIPANSTVKMTPRSDARLPTADKRLMATASVAGNISVAALAIGEAQQPVWMLSETTTRPAYVIGVWTHDGIWRSDAIWYGG